MKATARIAVLHEPFSCIRQVAPLYTACLIHGSWGPRVSKPTWHLHTFGFFAVTNSPTQRQTDIIYYF